MRLLGCAPMLVAASEAFSKTFGLAVTFIGIGVIVGIVVTYMAVQIYGERRQNREYAASQRAPGAKDTFSPGP